MIPMTPMIVITIVTIVLDIPTITLMSMITSITSMTTRTIMHMFAILILILRTLRLLRIVRLLPVLLFETGSVYLDMGIRAKVRGRVGGAEWHCDVRLVTPFRVGRFLSEPKARTPIVHTCLCSCLRCFVCFWS